MPKHHRQKESSGDKSSMVACPFCQAGGQIRKGFLDGLYYARCKNGCCTTKYADSEEEARRLWNSGRVFLSPKEKLR